MLTIVCGEDSVQARDYYHKLKMQHLQNSTEIHELPPSKLPEVSLWIAESPSLFFRDIAVFTEQLNKQLSKRANPGFFKLIEKLASDKNVTIVDWEDATPSRNLKITSGVTIKEFKIPQSIFKLFDSCYPGNLKSFVTQLHQLSDKTADFFIFTMLVRHIRNLVLVKLSRNTGGLQKWQIAKLNTQAHFWTTDSLLQFYDSLYRIDVATKSSSTAYTIRESLDISSCYFL